MCHGRAHRDLHRSEEKSSLTPELPNQINLILCLELCRETVEATLGGLAASGSGLEERGFGSLGLSAG